MKQFMEQNAAQPIKWDINQAISFIHEHKQVEDVRQAEQLFLKKIKETESEEQKAGNIYYLIRCKLMKHTVFETPECKKLYNEMYELFKKVEQKYLKEYRNNPDEINKSQMEIFYTTIEHYLGSLNRIYSHKIFLEASVRAHTDEMNFRKASFLFHKDYFHYFAYLVFDVTSKYGNSMGRWLFTTFIAMMVFGVCFFFIDVLIPSNPMVEISNGYHFFDYFYYSIITFVTLGYGDITPVTIIGKVLASIEVMVGYHMLGMLVNLLGKKM